MVGATAHMVARIFFSIAETPFVFYIGGLISGLGPVVGPVVRSMTSKVVPITERGKVFALLAVCDNAVPFFSGVLYSQVSTSIMTLSRIHSTFHIYCKQVYNATLGEQPGIFYLTIATQLVVFILIL